MEADSRLDLMKYICKLHNNVNAFLKKDIFDCKNKLLKTNTNLNHYIFF